jgi:hypothetical protein
MRTSIAIATAMLLFLGLGFAQGNFTPFGSIRGEAFTKGTNGEPAVLPRAVIVLHGPITKETEWDAQGAFAVDDILRRTYQIEANAPTFYVALGAEVSAGASSAVPIEMNVSAVTRTTSPQLTTLKAMDCAFSRKVQHA